MIALCKFPSEPKSGWGKSRGPVQLDRQAASLSFHFFDWKTFGIYRLQRRLSNTNHINMPTVIFFTLFLVLMMVLSSPWGQDLFDSADSSNLASSDYPSNSIFPTEQVNDDQHQSPPTQDYVNAFISGSMSNSYEQVSD